MTDSDFYTNLRPLIEEMIAAQAEHARISQEYNSVREHYVACNDQLRDVHSQLDKLKRVLDYCCEHQVDPAYAKLMLSNDRSDTSDVASASPRSKLGTRLTSLMDVGQAGSAAPSSNSWVKRWARSMLQKIS